MAGNLNDESHSARWDSGYKQKEFLRMKEIRVLKVGVEPTLTTL
jgi:hypothetical protein